MTWALKEAISLAGSFLESEAILATNILDGDVPEIKSDIIREC